MAFFRNRRAAGWQLARKLLDYADREDVLVLALPRGGVPVAFEVARELNAPLDVFVVRKLGLPGHEELAMGAISSGGACVWNDDLLEALGIPQEVIDEATGREMIELRRREFDYRGDAPFPNLHDKAVILVDDGLATGATMRAAAHAARCEGAAYIVAAVPVAAADACASLCQTVEQVVSVAIPEPFVSVSEWYEDFSQIDDDEVRGLLHRSAVEILGAGILADS